MAPRFRVGQLEQPATHDRGLLWIPTAETEAAMPEAYDLVLALGDGGALDKLSHPQDEGRHGAALLGAAPRGKAGRLIDGAEWAGCLAAVRLGPSGAAPKWRGRRPKTEELFKGAPAAGSLGIVLLEADWALALATVTSAGLVARGWLCLPRATVMLLGSEGDAWLLRARAPGCGVHALVLDTA